MGEEFLQFIWERQLFDQRAFKTVDGKEVSVEFPGILNHDSGPDFFAARIRIGGVEWCGNVEVHNFASEWEDHGHQFDPAYNNCVLHVVYEHDKTIANEKGVRIPTVVLNNRFAHDAFKQYQSLIDEQGWVPCASRIKMIGPEVIDEAIRKALLVRIKRKAGQYIHECTKLKNDRDEALYRLLLRSFGFRVNSIPFSILAANLPYRIILANISNPFVIESLLFGVAGFLDECEDDYHVQLQKEFIHQKRKYRLETLPGHIWKYSRMRPNNFPVIRIGQIASLLCRLPNLANDLSIIRSAREGLELFKDLSPHPYWQEHHDFGKPLSKRSARIGKSAIYNLLINTVVPFQFGTGVQKSKPELCDQALKLLTTIPGERNGIIKRWTKLGVRSNSAADSQGLIELKNELCSHKKCLSCAIGVSLLANDKKYI